LLFFFGIAGIFVILMGGQRKKSDKVGRKKIQKAVKSQMNEPMTLHPEINTALCIGCGACVDACPEGKIIQLINHKATLVTPTKCVGHGECEVVCPMGAIDLVFGTKTRGMDIPRVNSDYETNVPGLYIAGELGGMGLIRNAVKQGAAAAENALAKLPSGQTDTDLLIVGAGPAGLAAGLKAIEKKNRYICIDQQSFGGTVANFPRQKLVMSHPFQLPIVGASTFNKHEVSKEQLLGLWKSIKSRTGFQVREGVKFEKMEAQGSHFLVHTSEGPITAKKVILAMGVRGSPRKMGVKGEDKNKVTYNLLEPDQYQGKKLVVVGGGNAAAEVAQMLAAPQRKNKVTLLVRGKQFDRCNEDNQKRAFKLQQQNLLEIVFESQVLEVEDDAVSISANGVERKIPNDFVFAMIGAELPHKFLMSLGVNVEKKHGESRKAARAV
jgi:thioredoxin reductase (NADPH)